MEELKDFTVESPQVNAAIITAIRGILGIFINIAINMYFRKCDYRNKNRIKQIENMKIYYLPLNEKIKYIIDHLFTK